MCTYDKRDYINWTEDTPLAPENRRLITTGFPHKKYPRTFLSMTSYPTLKNIWFIESLDWGDVSFIFNNNCTVSRFWLLFDKVPKR